MINCNNNKKYFSLKQFCEKNKFDKKNIKYRNISNFPNCIQTTVNNICNKASLSLVYNLKSVNSARNFNDLFSIKTNRINDRNSFRDSIYFNKKDKKRIYKSYFSVEKRKLEDGSSKINNKYFKTICNDNNYILKKLFIKNSYNINNKLIKKQLLLEMDKYKTEICRLKKANYILQNRLTSIKEENNKIKININKENGKVNKDFVSQIINLINSLNNNKFNNNKINSSSDLQKFLQQLKNEYNERNKINDIINSIKKIYLEYNYSFSSKETKKIINFNDISSKILWDWIKNIPKLIFYEKIKNNLEKNKTSFKNYEVFIQYLFSIFEVNTIEELNLYLNKLINYK